MKISAQIKTNNIHNSNINVRPVSLKEFSNVFSLKNHYTIRAMYEDYLFMAGKPKHAKLTTIDLFKIEGIIL